MRVSRRRQVYIIAAVLIAAGLWVCIYRLVSQRGSVRGFEVHGSSEFHSLLLDSSTANCSDDKPLKMDVPASDREVLLDIHDFEFQMNQPSCQGRPVLVALVHSAPHNREKRLQIRNTWGSLLQGALLFVLGQVDSPLLQVSLESENDRYHDLLQGSFRDAYRNLTYKHVMALKWVLYFCPGARYMLKTDDDTFVNTPVLMRALAQGRPRCGMKKLIMCRVWSGVEVKRTGDKWMVTREEFGDDVYPDYCSGTAILYSQDVVYALYRKAQRTPYFWVDDVHVTGTLAKELNLTHQPVGPATLSIRFTPNNTATCDRQAKDAPPWVQSFVFTKHNVSVSDVGALWCMLKAEMSSRNEDPMEY